MGNRGCSQLMCALNPTAVWKHPSPSSHITRKAGGGAGPALHDRGGVWRSPRAQERSPGPCLEDLELPHPTTCQVNKWPVSWLDSLELAGGPVCTCVHACVYVCVSTLATFCLCASDRGLSHLSHRCKRGSSVKTFPLSASVSPVTWEAREVLTPRGICGRR